MFTCNTSLFGSKNYVTLLSQMLTIYVKAAISTQTWAIEKIYYTECSPAIVNPEDFKNQQNKHIDEKVNFKN